ncbi:MAG: hypothetical protein QM765_01485 [Myxococcales bacterium]
MPPLPRWASPAALALVLAVGLGPGLRGAFIWDDPYLLQGPLGSFGQAISSDFWHPTQVSGMYRPVVSAYFWLGRQAFGGPLGFHLGNFALHFAVSLLAVRWLTRRLGGSPSAQWTALLAVAILAAHPTRPESVTIVSGSTDVLMAVFLLLAAEALAQARWWWAAGPMLALAFLSKETALVGVGLLAADAFFLPRPVPERPRVTLGKLAVAVPFVGGAWALHQLLVPIQASAIGTLGQAAFRAIYSVGAYARIVVLPWPSSSYSIPETAQGFELNALILAAGLAILGLAAAVLAGAVRHAALRPVAADVCWVLLPLAPVSNFIPLDYRGFVCERLVYVPLLGVASLLARGLSLLLERSASRRRAGVAASLALTAAFAGLSAVRATTLLDDESRLRHELALAPHDSYLLKEVGRRAGAQARHPRRIGGLRGEPPIQLPLLAHPADRPRLGEPQGRHDPRLGRGHAGQARHLPRCARLGPREHGRRSGDRRHEASPPNRRPDAGARRRRRHRAGDEEQPPSTARRPAEGAALSYCCFSSFSARWRTRRLMAPMRLPTSL